MLAHLRASPFFCTSCALPVDKVFKHFSVRIALSSSSLCLNTSCFLNPPVCSAVLKHQKRDFSMATGHRNNKSAYKGIRFPYDLVESIDASIENEKNENPTANFSAWVLDACSRKLKSEHRKKTKEDPKG
ncbi:YlcI/YnfO family protein [Citrobacter freundii]|uniref:YlcI/YnfO family protein n=2 Tax=Enterobacterales TaxID=91347 RepID=UPI0028BF0696|nr:YlcI/YnfO family protein [Citrobacter freundii]MDT7056858.1 YlcI/YnfO family protein [Citrobacter freundii]